MPTTPLTFDVASIYLTLSVGLIVAMLGEVLSFRRTRRWNEWLTGLGFTATVTVLTLSSLLITSAAGDPLVTTTIQLVALGFGATGLVAAIGATARIVGEAPRTGRGLALVRTLALVTLGWTLVSQLDFALRAVVMFGHMAT